MSSYNNILEKLNRFTKKHYTKVLVKGTVLFLAFGLLFLLLVLGLEYFLWFNSTGRLTLLVVFLGVELFLLFRYIVVPLFYLFKLKRGMSNKQASLLIGKHFPEVGDKLYNLLDLADDRNRSELLLASIEQRSESLKPIPFTKAVNLGEAVKHTKYLVIPLVAFVLIWISGNWNSFFGSADRVVNFSLAYEPPAPFAFELLNNDLNVLDSRPYTIEVATVGDVRPEAVFIHIDGKKALLQVEDGNYQYTLAPPLKNMSFYFEANEITSRRYDLNALSTPAIQDFKINLDYPNYINKSTETLKSTGNATFPEGTKVTWEIRGSHTGQIDLITKDTLLPFAKRDSLFTLSKEIYNDYRYELATSNSNVRQYEMLAYKFKVIKDAYPTIKVRQVQDSLHPNVSYYIGQATDDYILNSIKLVCFADDASEKRQVLVLERPKANFNEFYYTFPSGLQLEPGRQYRFYFEVTDNDAIHGGKSTKSQDFSMVILDEDELRARDLESQQSLINNIDKSLENFKEQQETLEKLNQEQKEKNQLDFNDQNQVRDFLEKQQQQESMMEKFSKQLKENLARDEKGDKFNKLLQERLERQEQEARKNEKLLEEFRKVADKINKEELAKRLEELGKKQRNSERSLEQLLELTKRYYVLEKSNQLAKDLEKQAERQEVLSKLKIGQDFFNSEQQKLNETFENTTKELEELKRDNENLKKPLELNIDKQKKEGIKKDQQDALEEINKHLGSDAASEDKKQQKSEDKVKQRQKSAAEKMKQMAEELQQSAASGGGSSSEAEDAEMLRQILDNLIKFSFKQENLYDSLEEMEIDGARFSSTVRRQQELRGLFEHVDDSLFALSLRQAELSEFVNEQITEVYYNIDKSLENITEGQVYQGVSHQKYVLNASNSLADFLANLLDNMQQSMQMGRGQGQGQDFQLPDIIKGQEELKGRMEGMGNDGQGKPEGGEGKGKQGEGDEQGQDGNKNGEGKNDGGGKEKDKEGKEGEEGRSGGKGGQGLGEVELEEIYEIYKAQQMLRRQLEKQLQDMINNSDRKLGEKLLEQMKSFERDLLENGVTQRGLNKINNIQHELLKLENAAMKQGKKKERESLSNKQRYQNPLTTKPELLQNYRNDTEILNREALPLRQNYQHRVREYFNYDD